MRFFLLFSTLATATAISAKQALADLWTDWLAGASDKYDAYYADGATLFIDPELACGGDFEKSGQQTLSKDFTARNVLEAFAAAWTEVHEVKYEIFEKDANHVVCDGRLAGRSSFDGKNHKLDFIIKIDTDSNGKISHAEWHLYKSEKLDAHSVLSRVYADWKDGNPSTFASSIGNEFDFRVSGASGPGGDDLNGHYGNINELFAAITKVQESYSDDLSTFTYNLHPVSADGNSVSADLTAVSTYSNGARFKIHTYQTWVVNSMGKIVSGASTIQRKTPMNARAAWDATIEIFSVGDLEGVINSWADEYTITWTGDVAGMRKYWPAEFVKTFAGKTLSGEAYAAIYVHSMTKFAFKSFDFEFLSQSVDRLVVRFKMVRTVEGKDVLSVADWSFEYNSDFLMSKGMGNYLYFKEQEQQNKEL